MSGPFEAATQAAERGATVAYFERRRPDGASDVTWFEAPDAVVRVAARNGVPDLAGRVDRFLRRAPHGAAVGYLGFDTVGQFEPALGPPPAGAPFPSGEFLLASRVHRQRTAPFRRAPPRPTAPLGRPAHDTLDRAAFERASRRLIRSIEDGEAFQVVLAHRREWKRPADLWARARRLRRSERFAYFYAVQVDERCVVGAAPESVVEVASGRASVNPIAGTLPHRARRRRTPLERDAKELAEHRMLVDLARNDLGRIARLGSVRLEFRERRERYAAVDHLVSRVTARLRPGVGPFDALGAAFPAGTVSGAPKIRAIELLREAEGTWRGPYGGTVACVDRHRADFALAIRTAFAAGDRLFTAAGAGIVHRSSPRREFDETLAKLAHVEGTLLGSAA